jgi:hypothetical protein
MVGRRGGGILAVLTLLVPLLAVTAAFELGSATTARSASAPRWVLGAPMPQRRSYAAAAEIGGKIYLAGGMVGHTGRPLFVFQRFDPVRNEWRTLSRLPVTVSAAAGAALGNRVYAIGGTGVPGAVSGRQVYAYDIRRERWNRVAPLPQPRTNLSAVALGGKVYALGGLDPLEPTDTLFVYDPVQNRWSQGASLPEALFASAAVVFHGEIWLLGGRTDAETASDRIWIYDPRRDAWRPGPLLPEPMTLLGAAAAGDRVHVVLRSDYSIYAGAGTWTRGPSLRVTRHGVALLAVRDRLYAIGGCTVPVLEDSAAVESIALS